ncbi:hypothetical protein BN85402970 [Alteracholeplasma palmae J233]|uniref:Uncharacterized protein n=1 Tax=Alteracholeplasma palmae (strain ATCC 49389 / J233) TaxID=1318466 RepID=U4KJW9_ALTPJ|nr:hypothetical protein [Alteracholeplasma palmae]CCV63874.1 hypothetical protein BN85402970 [Alteracholeplasma palmae J233]
MKKVRQLSQTAAVVGFVLSLLGIIVSTTKGSAAEVATINGLMASGSIILVMAVAFIFATNHVVVKVGYGILAVVATTGISTLVGSGLSLSKFSNVIDLLVIIAFTISSLSFFIKAVLEYFGYQKDGFSLNKNNKVSILKRWNKLVTSNTIDLDSYNSVKNIVLTTESNSAALNKLNELVELLENNLAHQSDLKELISTL